MKSFNQLIRHEGNQELFQAVEMSVAALASGHPFHIHTEGLRGTGKTTILRSAASILPTITRIRGCLYNCDPEQPHCPEHRGLSVRQIAAIGTEEISCPFLEISHGAKISTIVGSIDLTKLTDPSQPMAALLPGTIPQAHRGIIFVDEINRLADASPEIADVLLDVMGTKPGRIQIEESGLPVVGMQVQVAVWAASNPDEEPGSLSQIRKQLSDRFDMAVGMGRPSEVKAVLEILLNRSEQQASMTDKHISYRCVDTVAVDDKIRNVLASIYVDYGLESLRAVEAMETAAKLNALLNGQDRVTTNNISQIVPLVLSHRADPATIANILKYLRSLDESNRFFLTDHLAAGNMMADTVRQSKRENTPSKAKTRLADWWDRVKENLSGKHQEKRLETASQRSKGMSTDSRGGSGQKQVADPTQIDIIAPPKVAAPLSRLSPDEFVTTDENFGRNR